LFNFYPQFVDLLNGLGEISGVYGSGSGLGEVPAKSIDGSPIKGRGFGGSFGEVNAKLGGSQRRMIMPGVCGVKSPRGVSAGLAAEGCEKEWNVELAEPGCVYSAGAVLNDPYCSEQWAHRVMQSKWA